MIINVVIMNAIVVKHLFFTDYFYLLVLLYLLNSIVGKSSIFYSLMKDLHLLILADY